MNISKKTVKIWEKNLKQNYRFFQPNNAFTPIPRTMREALGYKQYYEYKTDEYNMNETSKAYMVSAVIILITILASLWF